MNPKVYRVAWIVEVQAMNPRQAAAQAVAQARGRPIIVYVRGSGRKRVAVKIP